MPTYQLEVTTERGSERLPFTLDHDRALLPQVVQILEELRQRGLIVRGGADDELGAFWGGRDLDLMQTPAALGISPQRPLELRMRTLAVAPPKPTGPPKGLIAALVSGFTGGAIAWIVASLLTDLSPFVSSYRRLDQVVLLMLGAGTGLVVHLALARRLGTNLALSALAGLILCGAGALLGGSIVLGLGGGAAGGVRGFLLARLAAWALAGGFAALLGALWGIRPNAAALAEAFGIGALAGLFGALLFSMPGPSELWQALGFGLFGAGVGLAICGPPLWHAPAIAELVLTGVPGIWSLREWPLVPGVVMDVASAGSACRLALQPGGIALYPVRGSILQSGAAVAQATFVKPGDQLSVGGAVLAIRRPGDT